MEIAEIVQTAPPMEAEMGIGQWWRGLWSGRAELGEWEARAEAAYSEMYDARRPKDAYEDASHYFHKAIEAARRLRLKAEVQRLTERAAHVRAVYNSQFRGF
jgi:hypothetical protein